jgi:hypothetical protein
MGLSPLHEAARRYAERGWPVFPITPNAKVPLPGTHGHDEATTDLSIIDAWWQACPDANIGFVPEGAGLCVVDIDPGANFDLKSFHGKIATSPRGGYHIFYAGSLPPTQSKIAEHVDTRGRNSYVLLAPSVVDEKSYEWQCDAPFDAWQLPPVPEWIVEKCKPRTDEIRRALNGLQEDKPESLRQAKLWLAQRAPPVEFAGSDGETYIVACKLYRDLGLSFDTTLELLQNWAQDFDEEWLALKIESAANHGQNERGSDVPTSSKEAFDRGIAAIDHGAVRDQLRRPDGLFSTGKDRRERIVGPVEELIPGFIEKHCVAYMSGAGGLSKSRIAQHWGACVHTGTPVYGREVEKAHFVHVSYENGPDEDARRHQTLLRRMELPETSLDDYTACDWRGQGPLLVITESDMGPSELWLALEAKLKNIPGHKFIVFDSAYDIFGFEGSAKINETAVKGAIGWLDAKMAELDCSGLVIMHPSQAGMDRGDNSGWSVAWGNRPRVRITLKQDKHDENAVELAVPKRNNAAKGRPLTLRWDDGLMLPNGAEGAEKAALYEACVRVAVAAANGGIPITANRSQNFDDYREAVWQECGIRPNRAQMLTELRTAVMKGELVHREYDKKKRGEAARGGFFSPDAGKDELPY